MHAWAAELRLLLAALLNAAVYAGAYRFARRRGDAGVLQAACDAFVLYFVVQYAAVALPGVLGVFNAATMSVVAFGACQRHLRISHPETCDSTFPCSASDARLRGRAP